jgi:hypothetical protein
MLWVTGMITSTLVLVGFLGWYAWNNLPGWWQALAG